MSLDFVAIDFETASNVKDSACALGAAIVKNGKIVDRRYSLLNPKKEFERFCITIHGITPEIVSSAPDFSQIYPSVFEILDGNYVAAHNAPFDLSVLAATCESRALPLPSMKPFDSVSMAMNAWPYFEKYRLDALATHFGYPLKHHNAAEDATVCALIILKAAEEYSATSLKELQVSIAQNRQIYQEIIKSSQKQGSRKQNESLQMKLI